MYNEIMWQVPIAATPEPAEGEHRSHQTRPTSDNTPCE